ncbi:30S ribosomal protein S7e [Fonticula alba]|uniref:40S ribosomal protein S7 n=1 Tax=Fonticula alba TaxID=691883 RepID=A0A058ZB36_FONAL|nr:30S ribosomal protein S7e [Fonticula alba]KCV71133.1 30S ribosomal protein S7e [Fonticula alba]|eukprot:XP_009494256.1 30S ribosomal protein S7e [Fonticula alba]
MSTASKIVKANGAKPTEFEDQLALHLTGIEGKVPELAAELKSLHFTAAEEVDAGSNKRAIVIRVPVPQLKRFQSISSNLTRELEKKFAGKHVVMIANRRILPKASRKLSHKQPRPHSRTLTAVHDAILNDIVYPAEISGKRLQYKTNGKRLLKVFLDTTEATQLDHKLETFSAVYKKITGKDVVFEFRKQ